MNPPTNSWG